MSLIDIRESLLDGFQTLPSALARVSDSFHSCQKGFGQKGTCFA